MAPFGLKSAKPRFGKKGMAALAAEGKRRAALAVKGR